MQQQFQKTSEETIKKISEQNNEPAWLLNKRLQSLSGFKHSQMPTFVYGLNMDLDIDISLKTIDHK